MVSKFSFDAVKNLKAKYLSGGQRKKLCIAMALMSDPKIILMDEPFQGLDIMSTKDYRNYNKFTNRRQHEMLYNF